MTGEDLYNKVVKHKMTVWDGKLWMLAENKEFYTLVYTIDVSNLLEDAELSTAKEYSCEGKHITISGKNF